MDKISVAISYEDPSFFRRLFKRSTGLTPSQYRRVFQPVQGPRNNPGPMMLSRVAAPVRQVMKAAHNTRQDSPKMDKLQTRIKAS